MSFRFYPPQAVYIGLQKTGSTFLRNYFYSHPQTHCTRHGQFFHTDAADPLRHGDEAVRTGYAALFTEATPKPCRIDMYEAIGMGYALRGIASWDHKHFIAPDRPLNRQHIYSLPDGLAPRVKAAVADAKILITIRNQWSWIDSNYRHFYEQLPQGRKSLLDFLSTPEGKMVLDIAQFDRVIASYDRLFGRENVHVIAMELLETAEEGALAAMCRFLAIDALPYQDDSRNYNRGRSLEALAGTPGKASLRSRLFGDSEQHASTKIERAVLEKSFAAANARLCDRLGVDVGALGYAL